MDGEKAEIDKGIVKGWCDVAGVGGVVDADVVDAGRRDDGLAVKPVIITVKCERQHAGQCVNQRACYVPPGMLTAHDDDDEIVARRTSDDE